KEWLFLLTGALLSGLFATLLIQWMNKGNKVKFDNALSLILSSFFGFGLVLMTYAQKLPNANQAGIENFIYGQASSMLVQDVRVLAIATVLFISLIVIFWKELKIFVFDPEYTKTLGFNARFLRLFVSTIM